MSGVSANLMADHEPVPMGCACGAPMGDSIDYRWHLANVAFRAGALPPETVAQALTEFGGAIRGDWGSIDGRSVRAQLDLLADYLRFPATTPDIGAIRTSLDLCPNGKGHWLEHCDDLCVEGGGIR